MTYTATQQTLFNPETGNSAKRLLPIFLLESELKKGLVVKAKWNGEHATIKKIKDGNVYYNSAIFKKNTTFHDPIKVFLECFVHIL